MLKIDIRIYLTLNRGYSRFVNNQGMKEIIERVKMSITTEIARYIWAFICGAGYASLWWGAIKCKSAEAQMGVFAVHFGIVVCGLAVLFKLAVGV